MKLSTKTRYAVRAIFDIAYHGQGKATQARDIARRQEVPLRYLEQIFQELKRAKLIEGKRGPRGGYSLGRPPELITIGDVLRAMQGPIELLLDDSTGGGSLSPALSDPVDPVEGAARRSGGSPNRQVAASIWKDLATRVTACFDEVSIRDLCRKGEAIGLHHGDPQRHMYFI